jgi:anti-anti-sigma factor
LNSGKSFELEHGAGFSRLALGPELNAYHWEEIERSAAEILTGLETAKTQAVIMDLSPLDYLGSAQVALLVRIWKAIKARNGRMVVYVTAPVVKEVLSTAGLAALWQFFDTLPEAYQGLGLQIDGRPRMSIAWPIVGLIALAGAVAGLCASLMKSDALDARMSLVVQLTCSAVALAAGLWTVVRGTGVRRGLGIGMVLASALLAVVEVLKAPR